jgi:Ala-tRNA(Pro) deacylase
MQQRAALGKRMPGRARASRRRARFPCPGNRSRTAIVAPLDLPRPFPVPATREDLFARLAELGILTRTVAHEAVFTVAQSSMLERELPGGHTKNLFLKDKKGRLFLVVALGSTRVDLKSLSGKLGCDRLSFGRPELLVEVLGVSPGSVTPFALINDRARRVTVVLDADMMRHERLNCHPLENTATTNIGGDDLVRFIAACGHEPRTVDLAGPD